ncbi:hypothetical protein J2T57_003547 [Natronocella acetinitrilica]|uniref:Carboxypeptidase regulatory-like domain-containing protein n=1 Tax=Natronocella acetinitrilica TaxID=414046 RepID=A0AAE3KD34_9GAMM|nr:hypothetical protein [Natronocella acetinitrilica]MCP1676386.1 hypothetical protein [Natronocella acetinitrilica]
MTFKLRGFWPLCLLVGALAISACNSGGGGGGGSSAQNPDTEGDPAVGGGDSEAPESLLARLQSADGFAQKGPLAPGGTVTIQPLAADGTAASEGVATTLDTYGDFRFDNIDWHGPSLITVTGDWFSEATGTVAGSPVTLRSVVRIPEDESSPPPFPTAVNVLTTVMTTYVLDRMAAGQEFDGRVDFALRRLDEDLDFPTDPRSVNLFALPDQHPLDQQLSGVFTKLMAALSARSDVTEALALLSGPEAWSTSNVSNALQTLWSELRADARELVADGTIVESLTRLADNFDALEVSRQLSDQGGLGLTASCSQGGADQYGFIKLCLSQRYDFTLEPGEQQLFRFEAPYDGAFRFLTPGGTAGRELNVYLSRNADGTLPPSAHERVPSGDGRGLGTRIVSRGSKIYVRVSLSSGLTAGRELTITPGNLNAGSPTDPRRIYPDRRTESTLAGGKNGSSTTNTTSIENNHSYYRFDLGAGFSRIDIEQRTSCGFIGDNSTFHLYRLSTGDPSQAWSTDNLIVQRQSTRDCLVQLDLGEGPSSGTYWLKIINQRDTVTGTQGSGSRTRGYGITAR